jgi:hypothetical protein
MEPAEQFGRETDLFAEQLGKATAAQASFFRDLKNATNVRRSRKFSQGIANGGMQFASLLHTLQKGDFQDAELFGCGACCSQSVAQFAGLAAPQQVQRNTFVVERVSWRIKENSRRLSTS